MPEKRKENDMASNDMELVMYKIMNVHVKDSTTRWSP